MLHQLLSLGLQIVLGVLSILLAAYTPSLLSWGRAHIQNKAAAEAFTLLGARIAAGVAAKADEVRKAKDPLNTAAGAWTPERAGVLLGSVINDAVRDLPAQATTIRKGLTDGRTLDAVLHDLAEAEVEKLRRSAPMNAAAILTETLTVQGGTPESPAQATATASTGTPAVQS
jgi:type II secretory pathway pseudopilin PulG